VKLGDKVRLSRWYAQSLCRISNDSSFTPNMRDICRLRVLYFVGGTISEVIPPNIGCTDTYYNVLWPNGHDGTFHHSYLRAMP